MPSTPASRLARRALAATEDRDGNGIADSQESRPHRFGFREPVSVRDEGDGGEGIEERNRLDARPVSRDLSEPAPTREPAVIGFITGSGTTTFDHPASADLSPFSIGGQTRDEIARVTGAVWMGAYEGLMAA